MLVTIVAVVLYSNINPLTSTGTVSIVWATW